MKMTSNNKTNRTVEKYGQNNGTTLQATFLRYA